MKKFIVVIFLALAAFPVIANGVGEVGTDCASGVQGSRATVAETAEPAEVDTSVVVPSTSTIQ